MGMIDIKGLDKAEVLLALYEGSRVLGLGILQARDTYTLEDAKKDYEESYDKYFDYHYGRLMKVDLSGDEFNDVLYDRDLGDGHACAIIDELKRKKGLK